MPTPTSRSKILPARGSKANLDAALSAGDLLEGELCYAKDEDALYQVEGGVLVKTKGGLQPGDNVSELTNDAGYITAAQVPAAPVDSVNGQTGAVVLDADDIDDTSTTHKFATAAELSKLAGIAAGAEVNVNADWNAVSGDAQILNKPTLGTAAAADITDFATAAQGALADTAIQPGDNISELTNDAGYITAAQVPPTGVTQLVAGTNVTISPVGGTGVVTVNATLPAGSGGTLDGGDFDTGVDTADGTAQLDGGIFT